MKYKQLTIEERESVQKMLWDKRSIRYIAGMLNRSPSTISRELSKNYPENIKKYTPRLAQERASNTIKVRGRRPRLKNNLVKEYVISKLKQRWSPEQIQGCIKNDTSYNISAEAIYQYIYSEIYRDGYGYVKPNKEDLRIYLRRKHKRRNRKGSRKGQRVFKEKGKSIEDRPRLVEKRIRFGDWESDTVESCDHKPGINTLLERKSGYCLITKLKNKSATSTAQAIINRLRLIPRKYLKTITLDNGPENQCWKILEEKLNVKVYYAHPYSSWERGSNENLNGLIRDYYPKGTDFRNVSEQDILLLGRRLNTRPRKRLKYKAPEDILVLH